MWLALPPGNPLQLLQPPPAQASEEDAETPSTAVARTQTNSELEPDSSLESNPSSNSTLVDLDANSTALFELDAIDTARTSPLPDPPGGGGNPFPPPPPPPPPPPQQQQRRPPRQHRIGSPPNFWPPPTLSPYLRDGRLRPELRRPPRPPPRWQVALHNAWHRNKYLLWLALVAGVFMYVVGIITMMVLNGGGTGARFRWFFMDPAVRFFRGVGKVMAVQVGVVVFAIAAFWFSRCVRRNTDTVARGRRRARE